MTKIQYISLILLLILVASLVNLFYKPWLQDIQQRYPHVFGSPPIATVTLSMGSLYGFKCNDPDHCNCTATDPNLEPFDVVAGEAIYVMNRQLSPGRYCLPRGVTHCNQHSSYQIYTASGWKCVSRMTTHEMCHSPHAKDNSQNMLWDHLANKKADHVNYLYEKLNDEWRYRCKCDARDILGRKMVQSTPWTCSMDYCVAGMLTVLSGMGFNGSGCDCGVAPHANPDDKTSPCAMEISELKDDKFMGSVDCTSNISLVKRGIYCPPGQGILRSEETVMMVEPHVNAFLTAYLRKH